jgi:hypothetical protein
MEVVGDVLQAASRFTEEPYPRAKLRVVCAGTAARSLGLEPLPAAIFPVRIETAGFCSRYGGPTFLDCSIQDERVSGLLAHKWYCQLRKIRPARSQSQTRISPAILTSGRDRRILPMPYGAAKIHPLLGSAVADGSNHEPLAPLATRSGTYRCSSAKREMELTDVPC